MKKLSAASTCEKNLDLLSINRGELADASECVLQWWPVQCQWPCSQSCKNLKMKGCNRISNHKTQSFKQFEGSNSNANCSIRFLLLLELLCEEMQQISWLSVWQYKYFIVWSLENISHRQQPSKVLLLTKLFLQPSFHGFVLELNQNRMVSSIFCAENRVTINYI